MDDARIRRWLAAGLLLQALGVVVWWTLLFLRPHFRDYFFAPRDQGALRPFFVPDLLLYVGVGGALAFALVKRSKAVGPLTYVLLGGIGYATLYTMGYAVLTGFGLLSAGLMSLTLLFALVIWRLTR